MAITSAGYVGIGTDSPNAPLEVVGANSYPHLTVAAAGSAPYGAFLSIDATATTGGQNYMIYSTGASAGEGQGKLCFKDQTTGYLPMTMTSVGKVGIGTTAPTGQFTVVTANDTAPSSVGVYDNRHFVVGTPSAGLGFSYSPTGNIGYIDSLQPDVKWGALDIQCTYCGINNGSPAYSLDVGGNINSSTGYVNRQGIGGGTLGNRFNFYWNGSYEQAWIDYTEISGNISDPRLKENIKAMPEKAVDRIMALKPVTFKFKAIPGTIFTGSPDSHEGFLADQLQEVIPSAVRGKKNAMTSKGTIQPQTVDVLPIVAVLTKAVQEQELTIRNQQAQIDELKAMVKALSKKN
jgi:hypothetical protein